MKSMIKSCLLMGIILLMNNLYSQTIEEGIKLIDNENYTEATNVFEKIALDPKRAPLANYYLGRVKYLLEDYKGASEYYNKGLTLSNKCYECTIGLAQLSLDNGKSAEAIKSLESVAKSNKKNAAIFAKIGDAFLQSKKPMTGKAIEYLGLARDIDPKIGYIWAHLGDAFNAEGRSGEAMSAYENAVAKDKTNIEAYMSIAKIWSRSGQKDLAIETLEKAIGIDPTFAPAYKDLYELYMYKRNLNKMLPVLETYTKLAGSDIKAKVRLVKFLCYQAKDYERAITEGEALVKTNPEEYTLHRWLAWSYGESSKWQESYDESVKLFNEIAKDTTNRQSYISDYEYYFKAALNLKKYDEAAVISDKIFELDTTTSRKVEVYGGLAKAYYDNKDYNNAITFYKKKESVSPLSVNDYVTLGTSYSRSKNWEECVNSFNKVVELSPNYVYGYQQIAKCKDNMEPNPETKLGLAKDAYIKYVEVAKVDPVKNKDGLISALDYLGVLAATVEPTDKPLAITYFEQILAIDATNQRAIANLEVLRK